VPARVITAPITGAVCFPRPRGSAQPGVWDASCTPVAPGPAQPAVRLAAMHDLLRDCLPEGVYVECPLARLSPEGEATVAPAGGSRLLLRRGGSPRPDLLKLRGTWLGLGAPSAGDQRTWVLGHGDELLLGTDGAFDHLAEGEYFAEPLDLARHAPAAATLFDAVRHLLEQALAKVPQKDDITVVLLRRRTPVPEGPPAAPLTASSW